MRLELYVLFCAALYGADIYYRGYYTNKLRSLYPYAKPTAIVCCVLFILYLFRYRPVECHKLIKHAQQYVTTLPVSRINNSTKRIGAIVPLFDLTENASSMHNINNGIGAGGWRQSHVPALRPLVPTTTTDAWNDKGTTMKRAVSETKKKYVAASQGWNCKMCGEQLTHTFEIDHKVRLERGGTNEVSNLVALCRECHGQKTAMENM